MEEKKEIRKKIHEVILHLESGQRAATSARVCENTASTEQFRKAQTVMLFLSMSDEADTSDLFAACFAAGKKVCVPLTEGEDMLAVRIYPNSELKADKYGVKVPICAEAVEKNNIDFVAVPLRAVDVSGNRLGRGKGCYDRFLADCRAFRCGVGFALQLVGSLPHEEHDQPLDAFVSETGVTVFAKTVR